MSTRTSDGVTPWTVKVLAILIVIGIAQAATQAAGVVQTLVPIALGTVIAWAFLSGQLWVYTLMLFCSFTSVLVIVMAAIFTETERSQLVVSALLIAMMLFLLLHPQTRAFAGRRLQRKLPEPVQVEGDATAPAGVRKNTIIALAFLLTAIAIAGTLGVIRMYQMSNGG